MLLYIFIFLFISTPVLQIKTTSTCTSQVWKFGASYLNLRNKEPSKASWSSNFIFPAKIIDTEFFFPSQKHLSQNSTVTPAPCNTFYSTTSLATQNISIGIELDSIIVEERYITHSYYFFDDEGKVPGIVESVRSARVYKLQISCDL